MTIQTYINSDDNFPDRPVPKRLAILRHLQALLEEVSEEDGDAYTLVGKVYRNRTLIGADVNERPKLPAITLLEAPRAGINTFAGHEFEHRKDQWTILVQGMVDNSRRGTDSDDIYYLCQDVERRLNRMQATKANGRAAYPEHHMLGDKITSVEIVAPIVRPPEANVANNAFFYIAIYFGVAAKIGE